MKENSVEESILIVDLRRIPKPQGGFDLFGCPWPQWKALRKLGESHGWVPAETLPSPYIHPTKAAADERLLAEIRAEIPPDWEDQAMRLDLGATAQGQRLFTSQAVNLRRRFRQLDLYETRAWRGVPRMVTAEDAEAWAVALDCARLAFVALNLDLPHEGPVILNLDMHVDWNDVMNHGLTRDFIRGFCASLLRGAFGFAWDD